MSDPQDNATSAPPDADFFAEEPATPLGDEAPPEAIETTAPVDYESAFHQLHEHASGLANENAALKNDADTSREQLSAQTASIADLHDQLSALSATCTDFRNAAVVQQARLDDKTSEVASLTKSLAAADAQIAEFRRQRSEFKLWGVRVNGDRSDRMVLAEDGAKAHDKVPGAERIVLAAATLTW